MTVALPLAILAPLGGATLVLAFGDRPVPRRVASGGGLLVGIGALVAVMVEVVAEGAVRSRGLEADPWRAGLALGALIVVAAPVVGGARGGAARAFGVAASLATAASAVAMCLATDATTAAGFLVAGTAGFAVAAWASGSRAGLRAAGWFAVGDVLAVVALLVVSGDGVGIPPQLSGVGAVMAAVAIAIRCGVVPVPGWWQHLAEEDETPAALALGPLRTQGFVIAGWLVASGGAVLMPLAIAAAIAAAFAAKRGARDGSFGWSSSALAGLALAGLMLGGVAATWGAVLILVGLFLGSALVLLGWDRAAAPTLGAAPLGASLPGAAVVVTAALARGVDDAGALATAIAAALALAWLAQTGVAGARRWTTAGGVHPAWAILPGVAALAVAVLPARALEAAGHAGRALGSGRPLTDLPGAFADQLGLAFAAAAAAALFAPAPAAPPEPVARTDGLPGTVHAPPPRLAGLLIAIAAAGVGALVMVGIRRGFI